MTTMIPFHNPHSLVQCSPMSGVFGSDEYREDKELFITKVVTFWYCRKGNTIPVEGPQHLDMAAQLHDFYLKYCQLKRQSPELSKHFGSILHRLYTTGSITEAETQLAAVKLLSADDTTAATDM